MFERGLFAVPEFVPFLAQQGLSKSADAEAFEKFPTADLADCAKGARKIGNLDPTADPRLLSNILSIDVAFGQGLHRAESAVLQCESCVTLLSRSTLEQVAACNAYVMMKVQHRCRSIWYM